LGSLDSFTLISLWAIIPLVSLWPAAALVSLRARVSLRTRTPGGRHRYPLPRRQIPTQYVIIVRSWYVDIREIIESASRPSRYSLRPFRPDSRRSPRTLGANAAAEHDASAGIFSVPSRPALDTLRPTLSGLALNAFPAFARLSLRPLNRLPLITLGADNRITLRPTYAAQSAGAANSDTLGAIVSLRADYRLPLQSDTAFYGLTLGAGDCLAGESLRPILSRGANNRITNIALWPRLAALTLDRSPLRPDATSGSGDALSLRADWPTNGCTLRPVTTVVPLGAGQSTQTPDAGTYGLIAGVEDYVPILMLDFQP